VVWTSSQKRSQRDGQEPNSADKSMKSRTIKCLGMGLAVAASLATAAKADLIIDYTWVQASTTLAGYTSSGTFQYDVTVPALSTISFTEVPPSGPSGTVALYTGSETILPPGGTTGDLQLNGSSINLSPLFVVVWAPNGATSGASEQLVADNTTITGAWVPVPEPTTMIAGALLLLPFGASTLRFARKSKAA